MARAREECEQRPTMFFKSSSSCISWVCLHLILVLVFSANTVLCGSVVKNLPGFDGELPFKLETGYVTVNESELFYYFIESEGNPKEDPLMLWYSGGPGCSAFNGLIYEIGPLAFNIEDYEGGLPSLKYYPYSWTKSSSILFVDAPVGTGFSYATNVHAWSSSDTLSAIQTYEFLRKWLIDHPEFLKVQLFIGADSYSGISAPIVVQHVLNGNRDNVPPRMNLKGYIVGCPRTDADINQNSKTIFSHMMGFVSDELFESATKNCDGDYGQANPNNTKCYKDLTQVARSIKDINRNHVLEPKCTEAIFPEPNGESDRRSLKDNSDDFILSPPKIADFWCHNFNYALSYVWANDERVREALHIREGTVQDWKRCNHSLSYTIDVLTSLNYHRNLSTKGLQVLVYNGDRDLTIPNVGTQEWIKVLNLPVVNEWRPWLVDGEVAGYTVKYSNLGYRLTYATIKGAGHSPQEYKRRECFEMFDRVDQTPQEAKRRECFEMFYRWIHYYPL